MNANDFVTWLHGFVEACGETLTREQCDTLRGRLNKFEEKKRALEDEERIRKASANLQVPFDSKGLLGKQRELTPGMSYKEITRQIEEDAKKERAKLAPDRPTHLGTDGISWGAPGVHKKGEYLYVGGQHWWLVDGDVQNGEKR